MTTYNATVENGVATIQIDTTGMNEGIYDVNTQYNSNNTYNSSTDTSILTLQTSQTTTIDCKDTTQFRRQNNGTVATDNDGYVASMNNTGGYTILNTPLQRGDKLVLRLLGTSNERGIYYQNYTNSSWVGQYKGTIEEQKNNSSVTRQNTTDLYQSNDLTVTYEIDTNGYIHYSNSLGTSYTSQNSYTDTELQNWFFSWFNWKTNYISIVECTITKQ